MATIAKLTPGQVLYSLESRKMGNTTITRKGLYTVTVREIDPDGRFVLASWNGNPPRKFFASAVSKWRIKKPEPKSRIAGINCY